MIDEAIRALRGFRYDDSELPALTLDHIDEIIETLGRIKKVQDALRRLRGCVIEGGVPRYTVVPGAALNSIIEEEVDPVIKEMDKWNNHSGS